MSDQGIKLLRRMLDKAWPEELTEPNELSESEKDHFMLIHLLSWPTWPGFLKFFGKISAHFEKSKDVKHDVLLV